MRKANAVTAAALAGAVAGGGLVAGAAHADLLSTILKGGGIAVVIHQFARPLNDGVNKLLGDAGAPETQATKVVPIISVGQGTYAGAAQVSGPAVQVNQVQAVGQIQGGLNGKMFRLNALVPISTDRPNGAKSLSRVKGVGVSAIIDVHI